LPASITLLAEAVKCLVAFAFMVQARAQRMRTTGHSKQQLRRGGGSALLPWGEVVLATARRFRQAVFELRSAVTLTQKSATMMRHSHQPPLSSLARGAGRRLPPLSLIPPLRAPPSPSTG
jgi:hypothetical protein